VKFPLGAFAPGLTAFPVLLHEAPVSVNGGIENDAFQGFAFADKQGGVAL
jgi:hypothetical protein